METKINDVKEFAIGTKIEYNGKLYEVVEQKFCNECSIKNICPNNDERLNIILDITYGYNGNKQFCWDTIGDLICKRLEEMNNVHTE